MRQLVRQTIGSAIAVAALSALADLGRPIVILFPCVESGCFDGDAGCPHDEHRAIEWIYGGGEGGDTGRGQHYHRDRREGVG